MHTFHRDAHFPLGCTLSAGIHTFHLDAHFLPGYTLSTWVQTFHWGTHFPPGYKLSTGVHTFHLDTNFLPGYTLSAWLHTFHLDTHFPPGYKLSTWIHNYTLEYGAVYKCCWKECWVIALHRESIQISFQPSELAPPAPTPPFDSGGGTHSLAGEGAGDPIRTKGQEMWLFRYSIIPLRLLHFTCMSISLYPDWTNIGRVSSLSMPPSCWWAPVPSHYWKENICLCGLISQLPIFVQYLFASYMDRWASGFVFYSSYILDKLEKSPCLVTFKEARNRFRGWESILVGSVPFRERKLTRMRAEDLRSSRCPQCAKIKSQNHRWR